MTYDTGCPVHDEKSIRLTSGIRHPASDILLLTCNPISHEWLALEWFEFNKLVIGNSSFEKRIIRHKLFDFLKRFSAGDNDSPDFRVLRPREEQHPLVIAGLKKRSVVCNMLTELLEWDSVRDNNDSMALHDVTPFEENSIRIDGSVF